MVAISKCLAIATLFFVASFAEFEHRCIHDEVIRKNPVKSVKVNVPYKNHPFDRQNQKDGDINKRAFTGTAQLPDSNSPGIRVTFDTSRLNDNVDPFTCYSGTTSVTGESGTYTCLSADRVTAAKRTYLVNMLNDVAAYLNARVGVIQVPGGISIPGSGTFNCGTKGTPQTTLNLPFSVANSDLHIIVTGRPINGGSVLAYASYCGYTDQWGRSLIGYINFGIDSIDTTSPSALRGQFYTALHELTHVLGFSSDRFDEMIDPTTKMVYTNPIISANGGSYMNTPMVNQYVKTHFSCPTSNNGGAIEDGGGSGTAGSHWERTDYNGEYMCGVSYNGAVFSYMTMAWMRDSGWYYPKFSMAERLDWGFHRGCNFPSDFLGCDGRAGSGFWACTRGEISIAWDRSGFGTCSNSSVFLNRPTCQYFNSYGNRQCHFDTTSWNGGNDGGSYGTATTRAFRSTLTNGGNAHTFACHESFCQNPTQFFLNIDNHLTLCPFGETVNVGGYSGQVDCPRVDEAFCFGTPANPDLWTVTGVSPSEGSSGTTITITGTGFPANPTVTACGEAASSVTRVSDTSITAVVGATNNDVVDKNCAIVVSNGTVSMSGAFTLQTANPLSDISLSDWWSCAIATAAYGSPLDNNVWKLRQFRDQYLKQNVFGQMFIDGYYRVSPAIASVIAEHDWMRAGVRAVLTTVISVIDLLC